LYAYQKKKKKKKKRKQGALFSAAPPMSDRRRHGLENNPGNRGGQINGAAPWRPRVLIICPTSLSISGSARSSGFIGRSTPHEFINGLRQKRRRAFPHDSFLQNHQLRHGSSDLYLIRECGPDL